MGTLEDEKLFQMVHDFLKSESSSENPVSSYESLPSNHHYAKHYILQEIVESRNAVENAVFGCVLKNLRINKIKAADKNSTSLKKWLVMRLRKNGFHGASLCRTSWLTISGCPGGTYEYIEVVIQSSSSSSSPSIRLILDIDFKSQFELARPTPTYKELCDKLPSIFIGDAQKLSKIISILCSEAKQSLKERGLHIPPWRTVAYMQSKWLANPQRVSFNQVKEVVNQFSPLGTALTPLVMRKGDQQRDDCVVGKSSSALSSQLANLSTKCF
ncbi:OLC1v1008713C3 [Oldenlandia corymbosa var. corymbosa]|uniref:OLC1v1008713C3 n=1 Tax=Oldenlandia corymbosa var. corymbosa TaxID=529605 RepID=A0AAV1DM99_OLDCO|nr:OLC1v1008713C3 [Oldenlandia corymbosa var. corymbosa]